MKVALAVIFLLLAQAAYAAPPTTPASVVEEYCKLDFEGALTSSEGWSRISPLFVWPDGPGWDTFAVVRSYTVGQARMHGATATVPVTYTVLGTLDSTPRFRPAAERTIIVAFRLVYDNKHWVRDAGGQPVREEASGPSSWKIAAPQNEPHVGSAKATAMATAWLGRAGDAGTRKNAEQALAALRKAQGRSPDHGRR